MDKKDLLRYNSLLEGNVYFLCRGSILRQYVVTGMSCAACQARVEKAVSRLEGVTSCSVSLLTGSMGVEGTVSDERVIAAVEAAGYGATVKNEKNISGLEEAEFPANGEIKVLKDSMADALFS